jgi:CHASE2 domain-containing sensor protein
MSQWLASVTRKLRNNFYLYLSALLTLLILFDASVFHIGENMRDRAFDFMLKHRFIVTKADPDIIIVDINEASLNAMAKEYGRWSWPRQVFGEFVENIATQKPKAIVFDILFSDADVFNPDSDAYFNEVISAVDNVFFPMLRLAPQSDALSKITPPMIPGVQATPNAVNNEHATIAMVLPHFDGALKAGKLGTHNINQDADGIVREYMLWQDFSGWRIPALPYAVGQYVQKDLVNLPQNMLINWRGKPFTYHYETFSDVYGDFGKKEKMRPAHEFTGKIVIIGSTAPSLFDLKATAMARAHPGVEILATAIDNVKHGDFLKVWRGKIPYILLSLTLVWLTALAFFKNVDRDKVTSIFSFSQIGLLILSYLVINFANFYVDMTGPMTWAIMYFSVAKIYALANERAMQRLLAADNNAGKNGKHVLMMPVLIETEEVLSDGTLKVLAHHVEQQSQQPVTVDYLKHTQSGIWGLFSDILVVTWVYADENSAQKITQSASQLTTGFPTMLEKIGLPATTPIHFIQQSAVLTQEEPLDQQWRSLFAKAILRLAMEGK